MQKQDKVESPILSKQTSIGEQSHDLEMTYKKLSYLANHLDPYQGETHDQTLLNLLQEFDLQDDLSNPFTFTNKLLKLLDEVETKLKSSSL